MHAVSGIYQSLINFIGNLELTTPSIQLFQWPILRIRGPRSMYAQIPAWRPWEAGSAACSGWKSGRMAGLWPTTLRKQRVVEAPCCFRPMPRGGRHIPALCCGRQWTRQLSTGPAPLVPIPKAPVGFCMLVCKVHSAFPPPSRSSSCVTGIGLLQCRPDHGTSGLSAAEVLQKFLRLQKKTPWVLGSRWPR